MGAKYTYALGVLKRYLYKNLSALLKLLSINSKAVATSTLFGVLITITTLFLSLTAEAQQSVQVLWPLTSDSEAVYSAGIGSATFKAGPALKNFQYDSINGATATGWNGRNLDPNAYYEYSITPERDATLVFNRLKFEVSLSSVNMRTALYYSKDGFNKQSIPVGNPVFVGKKSSRDLLVETNITVTYPETLTIRVYGWSAPNPAINFFAGNVEFEGVVVGPDQNDQSNNQGNNIINAPEGEGDRATMESLTFNTSGTWICPANVFYVTAECWGGGGRGGSTNNNGTYCGGGGGGGYSKKINIPVNPGTPYTYTVGAGSSSTAQGGESWFISPATVIAYGGYSVANNSTTGANGAQVGIGTPPFTYIGGKGSNSGTWGAGGGGSSAGSASNGTPANNTAIGATAPFEGGKGGNSATPGGQPGGGGGGGYRQGGAVQPGAGGVGQVRLTWCVQPTAFNVTGGGSYCTGGVGVNISLTGSQINHTYQLYRDVTTLVGTPVPGTGNALSFGNQTIAGTYTVVATNTNGNCTNNMTGSAVVIVNPLPTATISGSATVCQNTPSPNITFDGIIGTPPFIFTYKINGGANITSPAGDPILVPVPTNSVGIFAYTLVSVQDANGCSQAQSGTATVTVNPQAPPQPGPITGNATPCPNISGLQYTITGLPTATSYTWIVPTGFTIIAGSGTNTITVSTGASGSGNITVTANNLCGNSPVQTLPVQIQPATPAVPGPISGTAAQCPVVSATYSIAAVANANTYVWSVPAGWNITSGQGTTSVTVTTGNTGQNGNISVTAGNGCGTSGARTLAVSVGPGSPSSPISISGDNTVCPNISGLIYDILPVPNATTYTWSVPSGWTITAGAGTTSITVTSGASGNNGNISVTAGNVCGNSAASTLAVTVQPGTPSVPGSISGTVIQCGNLTGQIYSIAPVANASSYTWTVPSGWSITGGQGTTSITVTTGTPGQNGNITVTATNSCGTSAASILAVTVNPGTPATPGPIAGDINHCFQQTGEVYSIAPVTNATTYNWTVPSGWTITAGIGTTSITVTTGTPGQNGNITVSAQNICGTSAVSSLAVAVSTVPPQTGPITPASTNVCQGATLTFSVTPAPTAGTTYTWAVPGDWSITAGQGTEQITVLVGTQNGNITITPSNNCGDGTPRQQAVTVTLLPFSAGPITGDNNYCEGTSHTYSVTAVAGLTYTWNVPAGWTINSGQGTNSITITAGANSGNITVTPVNSCGPGPLSTFNANVNPLPAAYTGPSGGLCAGGEIQIGGPPVPGNSYSWVSDPPGFTSSISNPVVQPFETTAYFLTETNLATGCSRTNEVKITTNDVLILTIDNESQAICPGSSFTINASSNILGTTYEWERDNVTVLTGMPANGIGSPITGTLNSTNPQSYQMTTFTIIASGMNCADKKDAEVIVFDNIPPSITCPTDQIRNMNAGACSYTAVGTEFDPTISDNCPVTPSNSINGLSTLAGVTFSKGETTVTWTVSDPGGFTESCTFTITVVDDVAPIINCVGDQTVNVSSACIYTHSGTGWDATATDNCSIISLTYTLSGATTGTGTSLNNVVFNVGTTKVTWTASDGVDISKCEYFVTVTDNVPPSISCPSNVTANTSTTTCNATLTLTKPVINDNCAPVSLSWTITGSTSANSTGTGIQYVPDNYVFNTGVSTVTYVVTDAAGLTNTCNFTITVTDNVIPKVTCPTVNASYPNNVNQCYARLSFTATASDNCQVQHIKYYVSGIEITFPYNFPIGTTQVTAIATDIYGNNSTPCTFNVVVQDTQLPVIACVPSPQTRTANTGACSYTVQGTEFDPQSFGDNCPGAFIINNYNNSASLAGAIFPPGNKTVIWTVQDAAGNKSTCSVIITVTDNEDPILINCPTDITVYTGPGRLTCDQTATWTPPTASDNCSGTVTITTTHLPGSTFGVGNTTVTYTATDVSGNSTSCSFVVTVIDNTEPTFTVPANITIYLTASCTYNAGVGITGDVTNEKDNCTPTGLNATYTDVSVPGACPGTFIISRTWSLTDNHGNTTIKVQTITVADNLVPSLVAPNEITVQCHQGILPAVTGQPVASDNCGNPVNVTYLDNITAGTCPDASDILRTWTATDCSGNSVSKTQLIHVRDNTPPVIVNVVNFNVDCPDDIPGLDPTTITATDNCGTVLVEFHHEVAQFPPDVPGYCPRHITRYYKVSDECGNFTMAEQEIVIASVCDCSNCTDETETYTVDLLGQPNGSITIEDVRRLGLCCHAEKPDDCISFNVRIDAGSVGVQITVGGAVPGSHEWKVNCIDVPINNGIICLPGGSFYLFTYCKPGSNPNDYTFTALADIVVAGEFESRVNCNTQIQVSTNVTNVTWNSISPGTPGQYNSYLSCTNCLNPFFNPGPGAPPVIKYQVCGNVAGSPCVGTLGFGCDTVTVYVHDPINVTFNVDPGQFCLEAIPQIIATVTPGGTTYILEWFAGSDLSAPPLWTGNGFTPPGPGPYTLRVTDTDEGVPCSTYLYPFIVAPDDDPPVLTVPADLYLECNAPGNTQAIQDWLSDVSAVDEHPVVITNNYNGIVEACNSQVTVIWTAEDDCGNITNESSTIYINDSQTPTWVTALGSLNASLECSDAAGIAAAQALSPIGTDQCDPDLTITKIAGAFIADPNCPQAGTYTNTFIAFDDCLNKSVDFTQVITIDDNTIPVWTTLPGLLDASFDCSDIAGIADAQTLMPVATDNCDLTVTVTKTAGTFVPDPDCDNAGTYTNTFVAVDNCNNFSAVYTQVISITDNNLPNITAQAQNSTVECDGEGNTTEFNTWLNNHGGAIATDACNGILTWTYNTPSFQQLCGETGIYTVTFIVTDDCDNSATTTATFTITDTEKPSITCPANVLAQVDLANCVATGVNLGSPVVTDHCSDVNDITITNNAPAAFPPGVTIVTWTATDACGNFQTCTQQVTVQDLTPPSVDCPDDPAPVNAANGVCNAYVNVPAPVVTDPCPVTVTNNSPYRTSLTNASGTYPVGTTTFTWTITGISGISATCEQTVTVIDNQSPTIACPLDVIALAPPPACTLQVVTIAPPTLGDNCDVANLTLSWEKTGATTGNGTGDVNGTIFNVGITTVEYTVTDESGNEASCTFTVTVNDKVPPTVVNCPLDITVDALAGECFANITIPPLDVTDPCGEIVTIVNDFNNTNNASGQYPTGTTTVTWTITDRSGNINLCVHDVTVRDLQAPNLQCPPDAVDMITNNGCTLIPATIQNPVTTDNCDNNDPTTTLTLTWQMFGATTGSSAATGYNLVNGQTFNVGKTRVLYRLADASGNFDTCSFYVWIKNLNAPLFHVDCPLPVAVNVDANADCEAFVNLPKPIITNPCNEAFTVTNDSPYKTSNADASGTYPIGITSFNWTIIDASGNVTTCPQTITVTDNMPPSLSCPPNAEDFITNGGCDLIPATIQNPTYSDNCDEPTLNRPLTLTWQMFGATTGISGNTGINLVNGQTFNIGITRVLYTLTDAAGNFDTCSFYVWIKNLVAPKFQATCPATPILADAGADCNAFVAVPSPGILNPCNEFYTSVNTSPFRTSDTDASGTYPVGSTTFNWIVTDASGNRKICSQTVTVTDDIPPSLTCPPNAEDQITNGGCNLVPATIELPITTDNCDANNPANTLTLTWQMFGATTGSSALTGYNLVNGQTFNVGRTRVLYTLTDPSGNTDTCSFYVWVKNLTAPKLTVACPANVNAPSEPTVCGATVTVPSPVITNPCNEVFTMTNDSPYADNNASGFYPVGVTDIEWIITDASGNVTRCDQTVTITDLAPVIDCPLDQVYNADLNQNYASGINPGTPTYSDNCGIQSLTWVSSAPTPGSGTGVMTTSVFYVGVTTIEYTVTDVNGQFTKCTYTITVNAKPEIDCPADISTTTDPGLCSARLDPGAPTLISGVEPITWTYTIRDQSNAVIGSGTCTTATLATCIGLFTFPVGVNTITWTASNISGSDVCTQTITVVDDEPLTFTVPASPTFCVEDIFSAIYDGQPEPNADIIPESPFIQPPFISSWRRPDWYVLEGTELDIVINDNCCPTGNTISWVIAFAGSDPNQPDISGTGQPSTNAPIVLWGTPLNVDVTHTITYTVTDCNGNVSAPQTINIIIKPRPQIIKQ